MKVIKSELKTYQCQRCGCIITDIQKEDITERLTPFGPFSVKETFVVCPQCGKEIHLVRDNQIN